MSTHHALAPQMIGRQSELDRLEHALEHARASEGRVLLLAGDAGVGKSRLIREFIARARAAGGFDLLEGRCYDEDPATPYGPFVDAIRAAIRAHGPEAIARSCDPWTDDIARLLPELAGTTPPRISDDPQFQKRRMFEAIASIVRARAPDTTRVVVLEDAHWADPTSQELVLYLAHAIAHDRLLLLISYRTDELHRRHPLTHLLAQLNRARLSQEIRLAPLGRADLTRMLESALARPLPAELATMLYDRTGGNPFFAEELLKSLIEHHRLDALIASAQQGHALDEPTIPHSIKDAILDRSTELDATTTEVLTYAAVIGRNFDFELLLALTGLNEAALLRAVELLVERQLVVEELGGPDDRYRFRHALTREAIYNDLLGRERRMRHREVLAALEQCYAENLAEVIDQLAYHSLHGRALDRSARYARLAGERAACTYAYREAVAHYEVALDLIEGDDPRERAELFASLGHAAYPLGDFNRCARAWREAQRLYEQLGDRRRGADLTRWLGRSAWERGDTTAAFAHIHQAIEILAGEPPGHELAMAYSTLSQLHMVTSNNQAAIDWAERALALADESGDLAVTTHACNNIGVALAALGEYQRGVACLERSLDLARQQGMASDELRAALNLGGLLTSMGQFRRAAEVLRAGIVRAEQVHFTLYTNKMRATLGAAEIWLGNWAAAHTLLAPLAQPDPADAPYMLEDCAPPLADLLLRQGRPEEARRLIEAWLPSGTGSHGKKPYKRLARLAQAHLALGNSAQASELIEQYLAGWAAPTPEQAAELLGAGIEIVLLAGPTEQADRLLMRLAAGARASENPLLAAQQADAQGLLALYAGHHSEAAEHFGHANACWSALAAPFEAARALRQRAASLLGRGGAQARAAALADLAAARVTCARLGAAHELALIDTLVSQAASEGASARRGTLTPRERQVIALIAQGYSNREIAEALIIAEKTAEVHVSNILGKLGFSSRSQAAAYAVEQGLAGEALGSQLFAPSGSSPG